MGLTSSLTTALTGLSAAETQIDVVGNNLANSQTIGFKSSTAIFATQFLQTLSLGAAPGSDNGGTNPRQIGLGVQVAEVVANHNQGTIEISSSPSDLAIQGDGFFLVQGTNNEQLYTRNGTFKLNASGELVNSTGQRLLGYGIDDQFRLQTSQLTSLKIPLGTESVAKATENVTFEGILSPQGDLATVSEVIQSAVLGDAKVPRPDASGITLRSGPVIDTTTIGVNALGAGTLAAGVYQYKFAMVDSSGKESTPSAAISRTVGAGGKVDFTSLPVDPNGGAYGSVNIYRTSPGGSNFFLLSSATAGGTFSDTGATPLGTQALDNTTLSGNYTYMITYGRAGEPDSRPSVLIGPRALVGGRPSLENIPTPPVPPPAGGFPAYDEVHIYRNLAGDQNNFYLVGDAAPGTTFTDNRSDTDIANLATSGNKLLDLDGPTVTSSTLLTDVLKRDGNTYQSLFSEGTLSYTGRKGGRALGTKEFEITAQSTVQELMDFITSSSGIQYGQVDAQNPIPVSENKIPGESGTLVPGASLKDGAIRLVSNTGELNALDIDLTAFKLTTTAGAVSTPSIAFGSKQTAAGQSAVSDFIVYDSLGIPATVRVTAALESRDNGQTVYRWYADSPDNQPLNGTNVATGTGLIKFDGNGNFLSTTNDTIAIARNDVPSVSPLEFKIDFGSVSGLAAAKASLAATRQDGSAPGVLNSYVVGEDGRIRGVFSNGITRDLGKLQLARFSNPAGLEARGLNLYSVGINTGLPVQGGPGENGIGTVAGGALELSNTDIGKDLIRLVLASTQYRGNSRVITTSQQLIDELLNLRR